MSISTSEGPVIADIKHLIPIVPALIHQYRIAGVVDIQLLGPERTIMGTPLEVNRRLSLAEYLGVRLLLGVGSRFGGSRLCLNRRGGVDVRDGWRGRGGRLLHRLIRGDLRLWSLLTSDGH